TNGSQEVTSCTKQLLETKPDLYWIVAANEGLAVTTQLARRTSIPIHLSIHDDPVGTALRSTRYRGFARLISRAFREALRTARSVDVISERMQQQYHNDMGVNARVVRPYIASLGASEPFTAIPGHLTVGFAGT